MRGFLPYGFLSTQHEAVVQIVQVCLPIVGTPLEGQSAVFYPEPFINPSVTLMTKGDNPVPE